MGRFPFQTTDGFQQVIYTPVGTIDVIAVDRGARQVDAKTTTRGLTAGVVGLRGATARLLHAMANKLEPASAH